LQYHRGGEKTIPRYWVIAPVESKPPELFDKVWQFDLANNLFSIGWKELGDVSTLGREELAKVVASTFSDKPPQTKALIANMFWFFYHEIAPGDFVIARRGRKILAAVGKVTQSGFYAAGKFPSQGHHTHPNFMGISWQAQPRDKVFTTITFPMHTLAEFSADQYQKLVEGSVSQPGLTELNEEVEDPNEFVLERYLEDFIVSNFEAIFKGKLKVYEDADGGEGQQYDTNEIGRIDILATDTATNSFVVIELKKGRPSDKVVGQTLRYMGWVKRNLCKDGQTVRGLVICRDHDPKLSYALEMTKDIDVRYYSVSFKLNETP
jgi:restriction system protein